MTAADIPALVDVAIDDICHQTNPRKCTRDGLRAALRRGAVTRGPARAAMLKIGISACFFHEDRKRAIFKGMTLQYIEQNVAHWLMQRDVLAFMVPSPEGTHAARRQQGDRGRLRATELDGLVLMGGSDVCPETYGEKALQPEWNGDRIRDDYEIALLRAFVALRKPVLGVCRGAQVINVALGGTLYQDIAHAGCRTRSITATGRSTRRTATRRRSCPAAGSRGSIPDARWSRPTRSTTRR